MYIFHIFISLTKTNVTLLPSLALSPIQALWLVESLSRDSSSGKGIKVVVWEKYLQLGRDQTRSKTSLQPDQPACLAWPASLPSLTSQPAEPDQPACLLACLCFRLCCQQVPARASLPFFSRFDYLVSLFSAIFGGFTFFWTRRFGWALVRCHLGNV